MRTDGAAASSTHRRGELRGPGHFRRGRDGRERRGAGGALDAGAGRVAVRGAAGAVAIGLRAADGAVAWTQAIGATEWANVSAVAALPGGDVAIAGSFSGTLRIGGQVVTSAGSSDGF